MLSSGSAELKLHSSSTGPPLVIEEAGCGKDDGLLGDAKSNSEADAVEAGG